MLAREALAVRVDSPAQASLEPGVSGAPTAVSPRRRERLRDKHGSVRRDVRHLVDSLPHSDG